MIAAELRLLAMAVFVWGRGRRYDRNTAFTSASMLAPLLVAVAALSAVEIVVLHLLLRQWSESAAWIATAIGGFSFIYLVGLAKSLHHLPSLLEDEALLVRLGHFHSVAIPYRSITAMRTAAPCVGRLPEALNLAVMSTPNIVIELDEPRSVVSLSGKRREFERVALRMDDAAGFLAALQARLPATAS